ncbi:MAG: hypothetical protein LBG76_06010 [Treponema sp.]|jgi:hypothetical protein|nr:hypothetical protein [Treponema sp.]
MKIMLLVRYGKFFLVCFFLLWGATETQAQYFKPFTALRVIRTEHFDIIYPRESEPTAKTLAGFADYQYDRISGLLGITVDRRIPVAISPHTNDFNGFTIPLPYTHIVLLDTPKDSEWWTETNTLEGLFIHELTHAISLNSASPGARVMKKIFGNWYSPILLTAPGFMVEGVTVSFESLDGTGRANDPLIREYLRQDILENCFHTPFQASGVYDLPPGGNVYYYYGGLFSAYLQKTYGMEKYAQLWEAMGRETHGSFFFYNHDVYYSFARIYGIPLLEAWDHFKESLRIENIEENEDRIYSGGWLDQKIRIKAMTAGGGSVFFIDQVSQKVMAYDPAAGKVRTAVSVDSAAYDLAASEDGSRLLVSSLRYTGYLARAVVTEYNAQSGLPTGRIWRGLFKGRYFRDGVIGLTANLHNGNIVYRPDSGGEEVLLRGNEELVYTNPTALDDHWIVLSAAKQGSRELCLYRYETKEIHTLVSDLEDDDARRRYIRGLGVSEGRILLSFNHDDRMYKLGLIDLRGLAGGTLPENLEAVFTERDFSGGVFLPVLAGGGIYYRGAFSTWDVLMRYPGEADALPGIRAPLRLEPWNSADLAAAFGNSADAAPPVSTTPVNAGKAYIPFKYMNPLRYWAPFFPLLRESTEEPGFSFDGWGLLSVMADPAQTNFVQLSLYGDWNLFMAPFQLVWTNYNLGFPIQLNVTDNVDRLLVDGPERITSFSLAASFNQGVGGERLRFTVSPDFSVQLNARDAKNGESAYTWQYDEPAYRFGLGLGLSSLYRNTWELFGRGAALNVYGRYALPGGIYRAEGLFRAALEPVFPLRLSLYGVWESDGMDIHGKSKSFNNAIFAAYAPVEYTGTKLKDLSWLSGAETEFKLFSVEIQRNLSHLYFNRFYSSLLWRGTFYDDGGSLAAEGDLLNNSRYRLVQSTAFRLGMTASTIVIAFVPAQIEFSLTGGWKISNRFDGKLNDFYLSPFINVTF